MEKLQLLYRYAKYLLTARTKYYIHSDFVYQLIEEVIYDRRYYYTFEDLLMVRAKLRKSKQRIEVRDYGAGSKSLGKKKRSISQIAKHAAIPPKVGHLLFRLVHHYKPKYVLELGTSLGISTLYMAKAHPEAQIITLEGCPETANVARQTFGWMGVKNVQQLVGKFEETLTKALQQCKELDVVFFDGNHQKEPTLQYFETCLPYVHNETIFIFDDIHWSTEMEEAWAVIQQHPQVSVTIDLFTVGLVFFRKEHAKEDFKLYF